MHTYTEPKRVLKISLSFEKIHLQMDNSSNGYRIYETYIH